MTLSSNSTGITARYRIIITEPRHVGADLAEALAHSAQGELISTSDHADGTMALIDVDSTAAAYLERLLEEDDRVSIYVVQHETAKVVVGGQPCDFDGAVAVMDADIRERLHTEMPGATPQAFVDAYAREHEAAFGKEWVVS